MTSSHHMGSLSTMLDCTRLEVGMAGGIRSIAIELGDT
jgi:hypothetical protein